MKIQKRFSLFSSALPVFFGLASCTESSFGQTGGHRQCALFALAFLLPLFVFWVSRGEDAFGQGTGGSLDERLPGETDSLSNDLPDGPPGGPSWTYLRDGVLTIELRKGDFVELEHERVWHPEISPDLVYFFGPRGELLNRIYLEPGMPEGKIRLEATAEALPGNQPGQYRLEVTGKSFRRFAVRLGKTARSVYTPPRVHPALDLQGELSSLRFYLPAESRDKGVRFGSRYENTGPGTFTLTPPSGKNSSQLTQVLPRPPRFDEMEDYTFVDLSGDLFEEGFWTLEFSNIGKVCFWLEGAPNQFYHPRDTSELPFVPVFMTGSTSIEVSDEVIGALPLLGVTINSLMGGAVEEEILEDVPFDAFGTYAFFNLDQTHRRPLSWNPKVKTHFITSLASQGRNQYGGQEYFLEMKKNIITDSVVDSIDPQNTTVAIYDEPNLRFSSIDDFVDTYSEVLLSYGGLIPGKMPPLAIPETSFILTGAYLEPAEDFLGIDFLKALLKDPRTAGKLPSPHYISWHEWHHQDVMRTDYYKDLIEETYDRVAELSDDFTLNITQTNPSPGDGASPYDVESFFTPLWLASAYIHSASTGKLNTFLFHSLTDDPPYYEKGLIAVDAEFGTTPLTLRKRMGFFAMKFLLEKKRPYSSVLRSTLTNDGELAVLAMTDDSGARGGLFIVNKGPRDYEVSIPESSFRGMTSSTLSTLSEENPWTPVETTVRRGEALTIPPSSLNFIAYRKP